MEGTQTSGRVLAYMYKVLRWSPRTAKNKHTNKSK
jgi:hypothetical protein